MDGQYRSSNNLFQSQHLPPPSQLHLQSSSDSFSRSNTLPPISLLQDSTTSRFHPISPYSQGSSAGLPPLPSPSYPIHRTSSSRDELHHSMRSDTRDVKREPGMMNHHQDNQHSGKEVEDGMPSTSDFVKKLYKMLEDQAFANVVSWGPQGDCFVVKDMNEFTKSILPRMFKHSNFASFVRQLNKYDFHKVKNTDDNQFGEHSWTFRHPDFHADRRDALENIKRKVPTQRKAGTGSGPGCLTSSTGGGRGPSSTSPAPTSSTLALQAQIERLTAQQDEMASHVRSLERNYQDVLVEMVNFQRNMAQQDGLMQNLIQYFLQVENGKVKDQAGAGPSNTQQQQQQQQSGPSSSQQQQMHNHNPFLPTQEAQRMMGGAYPESDVARASLAQMNEISRRAEVAGMSFSANNTNNAAASSSTPERPSSSASRIMAAAAGLMFPDGVTAQNSNGMPLVMSRQDALARIEELQRSRPTSAQGQGQSAMMFPGDTGYSMAQPDDPNSAMQQQQWGTTDGDEGGLQVFTLGHLMPKSSVEDENGNWSFDPATLGGVGPMDGGEQQQQDDGTEETVPGYGMDQSANAYPSRPSTAQQKLRVRRSTFVPGWAVPPRVLLVDDDAVSRKLSSKFLQVFGCTIDVAVDGVGAVNKMNLEKYDLVLMDIVMPKLDGVSATSLIRQFDHMTPIISMTSNSKPNEIMTYYSSGMNDILPKPFTKEGLLDMLEKHLMHLKVIQQMSKVPRSVGIPPLSDSSFEQALTVQAAAASNAGQQPTLGMMQGDDDGRINPLAGMGLTDEQYTMILQGLVNGESFPGVGLPEGIVGGEKRGLDESDGRDSSVKRGRFEIVE